MSIRFPKMHLAESVSNRILNIAAGLPSLAPQLTEAPMLPDTELQSDSLDAQLNTPLAPTELPGGADGAVLDAALNDESLAGAAIDPLLGI